MVNNSETKIRISYTDIIETAIHTINIAFHTMITERSRKKSIPNRLRQENVPTVMPNYLTRRYPSAHRCFHLFLYVRFPSTLPQCPFFDTPPRICRLLRSLYILNQRSNRSDSFVNHSDHLVNHNDHLLSHSHHLLSHSSSCCGVIR